MGPSESNVYRYSPICPQIRTLRQPTQRNRSEQDARHQADVLIHVAIGYILVPNSSTDLTDENQRFEFARRVLGPIVSPSQK